MLKILVICLLLATICHGSRLISAISQRITPRETNSCEDRKSPGLICESCELLSICVNHSNGWFNIPVETCDTEMGFYCNSQLGMCSNMTGPCHPFAFEGNFPCTSPGVFPDPYDCQKYHMCYLVKGALISAAVDCGSDRAFDAATGQCSLSLQHPVCAQKQFACNKVGAAGAWPRNPNIFYICKATSNSDDRVLYPTLYRCGDGEVFDGYFCHDIFVDGTTMSPTATSTATTTAAQGMDSSSGGMFDTTTASATPGKCSKIGLYADGNNCRKYYYCSAVNGTLRHMDCPALTFYNAQLSACTLGSC